MSIRVSRSQLSLTPRFSGVIVTAHPNQRRQRGVTQSGWKTSCGMQARLPVVPKGLNLNSRGRKPTVCVTNHIRPRRGRTCFQPPTVGFTHGYSSLAAPRPRPINVAAAVKWRVTAFATRSLAS